MAIGETCGFKTTDEEKEVYVGLRDVGHWAEDSDEYIVDGKQIVGIYNRLQDCRTAKRWNSNLKYFQKCKITLHKIEDVEDI